MSKILEIMNRPSQKKEQERNKETSEKKKGAFLVRNIKWIMFGFFNLVALVFDGLAVTTVYSLTSGNYLLSALALLPTGVPMFMWEGGWLYPLADKRQKNSAIWGIILSIASALVVGVLAIVADLGDPNTRFWVSVVLLAWCVLAVVIHGIMAAMYFYKDPIIMRDHELQVTIADNEFQSDSLRESEALLTDLEKMLEREQSLKARFGESEVNRALEILLGVDLNGDGKVGGKKPQNSQQPQKQVYASEVNQPRQTQQEGQGVTQKQDGDTNRPTNGQAQK